MFEKQLLFFFATLYHTILLSNLILIYFGFTRWTHLHTIANFLSPKQIRNPRLP